MTPCEFQATLCGLATPRLKKTSSPTIPSVSLHWRSPPFIGARLPPQPSNPSCLYPHDSLLPLRMLQQLMQHLRLLHVATSAGGGTDSILRSHRLRLQVHVPMHAGVVEGGRWGHVTHVLWCHSPDHVRI